MTFIIIALFILMISSYVLLGRDMAVIFNKQFELTIKMDVLASNFKKLDTILLVSVKNTEKLIELVNSLDKLIEHVNFHENDNTSMFFSTEEGDIQSNNLEDFINKLKEADKYKDIADDLKIQLEQELKKLDEEDEVDDE